MRLHIVLELLDHLQDVLDGGPILALLLELGIDILYFLGGDFEADVLEVEDLQVVGDHHLQTPEPDGRLEPLVQHNLVDEHLRVRPDLDGVIGRTGQQQPIGGVAVER